ncbi:MarR family winged helix-turn-helix transcriptional regulator [Zobellia nedashkovskayae]|uniref:MarR family winged helix-turn-helix transcriptional regulator n=1 Tax=Zobellia nedashkovskayae TaxID=2779510 RepID=UPI00188B2BD5|nr:helix-turn-helix domain-containing protein [Zobellia nedashkovskayae]
MNDFLTEIEFAGLNSRIKRLSDEILYSTRDYYKTMGLDIEPNWHLIFLLLEKYESMTITDISQELRMSHPACVKIINKMKKKGYVNSRTDDNDLRKQLLELSEKSLKQLPVFREHWNAGAKTTKDLMENSPHFIEELKEIELRISEKSYKERTLKHLNLK